ncbi:MAG: Rha family transcriptional regulator [Desulfovibrio sp.]|jgi:Rha family phage regulatory protein|nr:Rha family transcriptional regulator [Desulfovibrio sp.]
MTSFLVSPSISLVNGRPSVTSLQIAEHFGKRHDSILRDIRRITGDCPSDFHVHNFVEVLQAVERPDGSKIDIPVFVVFRDGFMLLVMGYTGKKALQIKLAYIAAFNAMEAEIAGQKALPETTTPSTPADRKPLRSLVNAWARIANVHQSALWPQVRAHFQLERIDDLPVEWIPQALAFAQGKIDEFQKSRQKALPEAKPDPNILPIRINFRRTRNFQKAREKADEVGRVAFNEGCLFAKKLKDFAEEIRLAFEPNPSECRGASYFDCMVRSHTDAMGHLAQVIDGAATAFVNQCHSLENLAQILLLSDKGTELDSVRMMRLRTMEWHKMPFPR